MISLPLFFILIVFLLCTALDTERMDQNCALAETLTSADPKEQGML